MLILPLLTAWLFATTLAQETPAQDARGHVISERMWHLGNDPTPEWPEAPVDPEGARIELNFEGQAFEGEGLLVCRHRNVNNDWHIELGGVRIATLERKEPLGEYYYAIPAGVIVDGTNTFVLTGDVPTDDITFGDMRYYPFGFRELLDLRRVTVRISDEAGAPLPARVTISTTTGELVQVYYAERQATAVRKGVVYTADGEASFEVPPGQYALHAARGTEWSVSHAELEVTGKQHELAFSLRRELDTTGFVAADTHIHTLTHSGHGDSSVEERMVTLAGEGVELAIATDHNHNTDYRPAQQKLGLSAYFTPVVGNEVTTPIGHLNGFPLDPDDEVPPYDLHDIVKIVEGIRAHGARAVILNHPRWPDHESGPHGKIQLDRRNGDWVGTWACPFDAVELINSQTEELEPMLLFHDWFALLGRGERVFAVGSSDSHTVGGVVGQGRTYVQSSTDDPDRIDIDEAARNIATGHSSISMGIFADMRRAGRSVLGETLTPGALDLRITAPSWVQPRTVTVFANGVAVLEQTLDQHGPGEVFDLELTLPTLGWPAHDYYVVAIVQGDGVGGVWWPQLNDYTLGATNPVFIDRDGDGRCSDPRTLATRLVESRGTGPEAVLELLGEVDAAVAAQVLRLVRLDYVERAERDASDLAEKAAKQHPELEGWL